MILLMSNEMGGKEVTEKMRKSLSKSLRFEVFKRDSFTCQYCGSKAPDVILHVDHIRPVADGGENDLLNLVTACSGCNLGKSDTLLSDQSVLARQREQIEELNERRAQLEMMVEWREGLHGLEEARVEAVQKEFLRYGPFKANESGEREIKKWLKKYSLDEIFKAVEASYTQYLKEGDDGNPTGDSWSKAFDMVPRIINVNRNGGLSDEMKSIFYARGILRRRLRYLNEARVISVMKQAIEYGWEPDTIIEVAKSVTSWREFREILGDE